MKEQNVQIQNSDSKQTLPFLWIVAGYFLRAKEVSKKKGIYYVICAGVKIVFNELIDSFWFWYCKIFKFPKTFVFQGETYGYFYHKHNKTWRNERAVEVPIIWRIVNEYRERDILEVGNTLSHYFSVKHDIVDKYEKSDGVINQDVVDFQPAKKYNLIVSISTLEHVGWDESQREFTKILRAIENLKRLVVQGGKIVVTLPLGSNPEIDRLLKEGKIQFTRFYCLKRVSADNSWIETDWRNVQNAKYDKPFPGANGLVIGIIEKE